MMVAEQTEQPVYKLDPPLSAEKPPASVEPSPNPWPFFFSALPSPPTAFLRSNSNSVDIRIASRGGQHPDAFPGVV